MPLYFTVDTGDTGRSAATLAPQAILCAPAPDGGFVSVFTSDTAIEGCSKLTPSGTLVDLLEYADFDRCTWGK